MTRANLNWPSKFVLDVILLVLYFFPEGSFTFRANLTELRSKEVSLKHQK